MIKECVFCGEHPQPKTLEHVLPRWLIELTGDPNRMAEFGDKDISNPKSEKRVFSFDSLRFPACKECNHRFASLESDTQVVIGKILSDSSVSAAEFNNLLNWFDKVRVGLWLGFRYLEKNVAEVTPKFHISKRMGANDRMLVIYKHDSTRVALNLVGCDMPSFHYTPSCFSLRINNYWFLNISFNDLLSRRIGFPFPIDCFLQEDGTLINIQAPGRNRVMIPLLKKRLGLKGTEIYQPMFKYYKQKPEGISLYDTEYVRDNSLSWENGVGKVFIMQDKGLDHYPDQSSMSWIPPITYEEKTIIMKMQIMTLELQEYIDSLAPSTKLLSKESSLSYSRIWDNNRRYNKALAAALRDKAAKLGISLLPF